MRTPRLEADLPRHEADPDRPDRPARGGRRRLGGVAMWIVPALVALAVGLLTWADVNGSSAALTAPGWQQDDNLLYGSPRGIRSDEFFLFTPNMIGNVRRGMPVDAWIGLTPTNMPAAGLGLVSAHWTELFKPHDWGFFVLPVNQGFTFRWWAMLGIGIVGAYALMFVLTRRIALSAGLAVVSVVGPYVAWWSQTPALCVGFLAGAAACVVTGTRSRGGWRAALWGLAAAWLAMGAAMILYPPWQVPVALVAAAVIVGVLLDERPRFVTALITLGTGGTFLLAVLAAWYVQAHDAIAAQAETIYPGHRLALAAKGNLSWMLDAPSSLWFTAERNLVLLPKDVAADGSPMNYANPSEISSTWIPLPLLGVAVLLLLVVTVATLRDRRTAAAGGVPSADSPPTTRFAPATQPAPPALLWTAWLVSGMTALMVAWAVLPVPAVVGKVTLLSYVPGYRISLGIGFGAALSVVLIGTVLASRRTRWWIWLLALAGTVATAAAWTAATGDLPWNPARGVPDLTKVAVVSAVVGLGFGGALAGRRFVAGTASVLLAVVTFGIFAQINPWYRGLGPMDDDPLVTALLPEGRGPDPARVALYDLKLYPLVSSTGVENLSGLTIYPDRSFWERVAPDQERMWNMYAKYSFVVDSTISGVRIEPDGGTSQKLRINPCGPVAQSLGIDLSLSTAPLTGTPCLKLDRTLPWHGKTVYFYRPSGA